jgi:hypothetical protein
MLERIGLQPGSLRLSTGRRPGLAGAVTLDDVDDLAHRALPRMIADFIDGGAEDEATVTGNRAAFGAWNLVPRMLVGVDQSPGWDRGMQTHGTPGKPSMTDASTRRTAIRQSPVPSSTSRSTQRRPAVSRSPHQRSWVAVT